MLLLFTPQLLVLAAQGHSLANKVIKVLNPPWLFSLLFLRPEWTFVGAQVLNLKSWC